VLMRGTVHVVSAPDYGLFAAALDVAPPGWVTPEAIRDAVRVTPALRAFTAEPRTRTEVFDWLDREHGVESGGTTGVWYALRLRARIGYAPESSLWSSPIHNPRFVALEHDDVDGEVARAELVRRYLAAFGPATRAEIAGWSGMKVGDFAHLLEGLVALRDDRGRQLLDLPRAPRPGGETPAPVRFLPKFDNVLLDRARVLPEAYRKLIVRKNADVQPTFTVDGYVAGIWRVENDRVLTEAFAPLPRTAKRELADEAARLLAWLG
jgi:winged helix DNA-binding protein